MKILLLYLVVLLFAGCSGCSKTGRLGRMQSHSIHNNSSKSTSDKVANIESSSKENDGIGETEQTWQEPGKLNVVRMLKEGGVYKIPIEVNGVPMYFIFDTGASMISISSTEATFLYKQGKLEIEDVVGVENFIDATGNISPGVIVNLKSVRIGNKKLTNITASVTANAAAPLLLGQSALEQFGTVTIDYKRLELTFN